MYHRASACAKLYKWLILGNLSLTRTCNLLLLPSLKFRRTSRMESLPACHRLCPREELNLFLGLRSPLFYPLNYRGSGNWRAGLSVKLRGDIGAGFYPLNPDDLQCRDPDSRLYVGTSGLQRHYKKMIN